MALEKNIEKEGVTEADLPSGNLLEKCYKCGTLVSYEFGVGNPICPNKECDVFLVLYDYNS